MLDTTQSSPVHAPLPTAKEMASTLALTDGDVYLAAERLHLPRETGPTTLLYELGHDPEVFTSLMRQLKAKAAIATYRDMIVLQEAIIESHTTFDPRDKIAAFNALAAIFSKVSEAIPQLQFNQTTQNNTQYNLNTMDHVLRQLPADVRDAVKELAQTTPSPQYLEGDEDDLADVTLNPNVLEPEGYAPTTPSLVHAEGRTNVLPLDQSLGGSSTTGAPTLLPLRVPPYRKPRARKSDIDGDDE